MKKTFELLLLLLLNCSLAIGQTQYLRELEPNLQAQESPSSLRSVLDSASKHTRVKLHAKYFEHHLGLEDAQYHQSKYYWKLESQGFKLRAYLNISISPNDSLIVYDASGKMLGFIQNQSFNSNYWISPEGENGLILKYIRNSNLEPQINISGYSLGVLTYQKKDGMDFGNSDFCEVNIECPEGSNYADVEKSVVRINVKLGGFEGWCTGTLINNTAQDFKPYILTAEHCGLLGSSFAGPSDLSRWEFDFNYQGENCSNPSSESDLNFFRIIGSELLARSDDNGGDFGSDFALLNLVDTASFNALPNPYFAGWDRSGSVPQSGVCIHHPEGDIKKVSTFTSPADSSEFGGSVKNTHWRVRWAATSTNHGVTEPGSSGGPLFNQLGLFKGGLTGGAASCFNNTAPDWYGMFSYSWDKNGSANNRKLQPWLDPLQQGAFVMGGAYRGDSIIPGPGGAELELAPNPSDDGIISIWNMAIDEIADVYVYDLAGNIVFEREKLTGLPGNIGLPELDLSRLRNGLYIVRIDRSGTEVQNFKIRIQR